MTFPRKIGLVLLFVAVIATMAHLYGVSLPTLRWFYSFRATPDQIQNAPDTGHLITALLLESQHVIVGHALCGVMAVAGVLLLALGGKFQWNPLTLRRFARFRSIGRGWTSLQLLMVLIVLAMLDQVLVGKRALAVKYEGNWYFPAFREKGFSDKDFGGAEDQEANYRKLYTSFREAKAGNKVILPPVPWDPTFDSDEVLQQPLVEIDGKLHRSGEPEPYNGQATQFQEENPELQARTARFRKGLRDGSTSIYDAAGEYIGREEWVAGVLTQTTVEGEPADVPAGSWQELIYPPAPPFFKSREKAHLLGTDSKGWDIAAQLYGGLQVILKAAVFYVALTYGIGIVMGCLQGYYGGWFDIVIQRIAEVLSNVPFLLVVMIITANIGLDKVSLVSVLLIFCVFSWINVAIYLRTSTFREKARDYVAAARVQGAGTSRVIFRHILPNAISTLVTLLPFSVAGLASMLTALDFLGFGLPERYPSWGRLLDDGTSNLSSPWIVSSVFGILVTVLLIVTFIGEAIREAFDPKKYTTYQ